MNKKINMLYSFFLMLLVCGLSGILTPTTFSSNHETATMSLSGGLGNNQLREYGANETIFSSRVWSSLSAARSYYGYDYSYSSCNFLHNGITYNYYFSFSDNSRCYFKVI